MKEAVTKVIDICTQEEFYGAFQKLLERENKCIATGGDYFKDYLKSLWKSFFFITLQNVVNESKT